MIKKNPILLVLILLLCLNKPVMSFDDAVLDPLDLNKKDQKVHTHIRNIFKKAYITAITADSYDKALVVTAIPEVNSTTKSNDKLVEIDFPNCYLHKSISSRSYNWNLKLRNQYPAILGANVYRDDTNNKVVVELEFERPVKILIKRVSPSKIKYVFEMISEQEFEKTEVNKEVEIIAPRYSKDLKEYMAKPSGNYITIEPHSKGYILENKSNSKVDQLVYNKPSYKKEETPEKKFPSKTEYNSLKSDSTKMKVFSRDKDIDNTEIQRNDLNEIPSVKDSSSSLDLDKAIKFDPQDYSRSDNVFDKDSKVLPSLERPEQYNNSVMTKNDYSDILKIGMSFEAQKRYDEAIQKFSQAINVNSDRYEAYSALGDIYLKQQRDNLAIENYEKSLKINQNQPKVIYNLGIAYTNNNDNLKAIQQFKKVIDIQPTNYSANYHLANQYYLKNDYLNAISYYEICLELSKKSKNYIETSKIFYNIANSYREIKKYSKAITYYKRSLKLFNEFADAHYNLAATYVDSGQYKEAIAEFEAFKKYASSKEEIEKVNKIIKSLKT